MRYLALLALAAATGVGKVETSDTSARIAALRFAVHNGMLEGLRDSMVVTIDPEYGAYVAIPVALEPAALREESRALARLLSDRVSIATSADVLYCVRFDCVARGRWSVVVVSAAEASADGMVVGVKVYEPAVPGRAVATTNTPGPWAGAIVRSGVVRVERGRDGLVGIRWLAGPSTAAARVQPPG
jgi:hypothetical protein